MAGIVVSLEGTLTLQQADPEGGQCPPAVGADLGVFPLALSEVGLLGVAGATGSEISQGCFTIASPAAFVPLAFPSSFRARLVYLRSLTSGAAFDVRLTHAAAGAVTYPSQFLMLNQVATAEQVSQIEVQGTGSFAWAAVGVLV